MPRTLLFLCVFVLFASISYFPSCKKSEIPSVDDIIFKPRLSEYNIYKGGAGSLVFDSSFVQYELSTALFSDYAEKQRLIKIPVGTKINALDDGLPNFPDGSIIVKTFYYYNNKKDTARGKRIMETRLLIKHVGKWNAATYIWNQDQTDAKLISAGRDIPVNWIDEEGNPRVISYHVPSRIECGMCHQSNKLLTPIGPKIINLNFNISYNGSWANQLTYLQNSGVLTPVNPANFSQLPQWNDTRYSIEQRARAYLDLNCAHCHNSAGFASHSSLKLNYDVSLSDSKIGKHKKAIDILMSRGAMPLIGTTVVDHQGLQLVREYLKTLD